MIAQGGVVPEDNRRSGPALPLDSPARFPTEVFSPVRHNLGQVEEALRRLSKPLTGDTAAEVASCINVGSPECPYAAVHLLSAGLCGYRGPFSIVIGTILELISTGSKIHHKLAGSDALAVTGSTPTVLAGDWAYLKAIRPAVELRNFRVLDLLIEASKNLVEGDLIESGSQHAGFTEERVLDLCYYRTACLFGLSCRLGAVLAGSDLIHEKLMRDYGLQIGFAWQLATEAASRGATHAQAHSLRRDAAKKAELCLDDFPDSPDRRALKSLSMALATSGD